MPDRQLIDVHVLLTRDAELLLTQRQGDTVNGLWHLPSGTLDTGEDALTAATREAEEQLGVIIDPAELTLVHTIHVNGSRPEPRLGLFFATDTWIGEPANREPETCSGVGWFDLHALPLELINYPAAGIIAYRNGTAFSTMGWNAPTMLRT